jgi:hypothetical protein
MKDHAIGTETTEEPCATWAHDQDLSFKRINGHLQTLVDALQQGVDRYKQELARMIGARDLVRK